MKKKKQRIKESLENMGAQRNQSDLRKELIIQIEAIIQAIYIGICLNLMKKELVQSYQQISGGMYWLNARNSFHQDPVELILDTKFKPILLLDPCSEYLKYKQAYVFQKYRKLELAQYDREIIYRCSYERPGLSKEIFETFSVVNMEKLMSDKKRTMFESNALKELEKQVAYFKKEYQELKGMIQI
ncbi:hypothetical protein FGO68_gene16411 [Halteria grandinella]|uniref:Uncharacterized protein n=1 Tax=Halteria grandinella TaxID=5974 RepID=A0A8J8NDB7_HALGN|nr:hypothetical protein FGO68_gene16411 [Halteria grandinella]